MPEIAALFRVICATSEHPLRELESMFEGLKNGTPIGVFIAKYSPSGCLRGLLEFASKNEEDLCQHVDCVGATTSG